MARRRSLELPSDSPPDISSAAGAHSAEDILQRLSTTCSPVLVPRNQAATVNAEAANRGSKTPQHAFRRLNSLDSHASGMGSPAGQPLSPSSRMDSFGTPSVHGAALPAEALPDIYAAVHGGTTQHNRAHSQAAVHSGAPLVIDVSKYKNSAALLAKRLLWTLCVHGGLLWQAFLPQDGVQYC